MDNNHPNAGTIDQEHAEALKRMGNRIDLSDAPAEPATEEPQEPQNKEEVITPPEPEKPAEPAAVVEPKAEEDKPVVPDPKPAEPVNRPATFIPVDKYTNEKKAWNTEKAELQQKIADLEAAGQGTPAQVANNIEELALEYDADPKFIEKLVSLAREGMENSTEHRELLQQMQNTHAQNKEVEAYEAEFAEDAVPQLKRMYPNATQEQLDMAKKVLWEPSHTEANAKTKLRHIVVDIQEQLDGIFVTSEPEAPREPEPNMHGMESRKPGAGAPSALTASDFKGKKDFSELDSMNPEQSRQIVLDMDGATYSDYINYHKSKSDLTVFRNGRKVNLK